MPSLGALHGSSPNHQNTVPPEYILCTLSQKDIAYLSCFFPSLYFLVYCNKFFTETKNNTRSSKKCVDWINIIIIKHFITNLVGDLELHLMPMSPKLYNLRYFICNTVYAGKADLTKGFWYMKRKLWATMHFNYHWKILGSPQFSFWIPITLTKIYFFLYSHKPCKNTSALAGTIL